MEFHARQVPAPRYWEAFEDLCLDLFRCAWRDVTAQKNGRRGQRQHGTDIWGRPKDAAGAIHGIQCKGKDRVYGTSVTEKELREEVAKAKGFSPPLSHWILATTASKDAAIETLAREITAEHQQSGLFTVQVLGWEDLQSLIAGYDDVIEKHYPEQGPSSRKTLEYFRAIAQLSQGAGAELPLKSPERPLDVEAVERAFGAVSRTLLGWPQETAGHWLERPELEQLHSLATQAVATVAVLLGGPGDGKSAVLARLGNQLVAEGALLLAIKADQMPRTIGTLAELDAWIGCPVPVTEALRRLAAERRVVLLIDQLDALADLMDQHSERLSVLLRLVGTVADTPNLQVLLSCRAFEFRNDVRLNTLKTEAVTLARPSWEQVLSLLTARGLHTEGWSDEVRDVLRTPQHLAVFLTYFPSGHGTPAFSSYHGLLDRVVRERLETAYSTRTVEAAESIATEMAREEELWLARDRFELEFNRELKNLIAAEFLVLSEDGLSLAFRHQTFFDFVRARAFLRSGLSLADHVIAEKQESLFVRPILWSALQHLRGADRAAYRREFRRLWTHGGLRLHIRYLLVSFLGQVSEPDDEEAHWLLPTLDDPELRLKALRAMIGNPGWFSRLQGRLALLMTAPSPVAWLTAILLSRAVVFASDSVLSFVERYWLPHTDYSGHALQVFYELPVWDERTVALAAMIADRSDVGAFNIGHLVTRIAQTRPDLAPEIVVRNLEARVRQILSEARALSNLPIENVFNEASVVRRLEYEESVYGPFTRILEATTDWHDLDKLVARAPQEFIARAWPWLIDLLERLAYDANPLLNEYRRHRGLTFSRGRHTGEHYPLPRAFEVSIRAFAGTEAEAFLHFVETNKRSDLIVVHHLLAIGLERVAQARPRIVLEYLLEDPRRLALGDFHDTHSDSLALLASVVPALDAGDALRLERAIIDWQRYREIPRGEAPAVRFERQKWAREHRLRLLRSFPRERLSPEARRLLMEEERALPDTPNYDHEDRGMVEIGSPMSAGQMSKASDDDIVELFEEVTDDTGWDHPRRRYVDHGGGSIQASREFANFAKVAPERALRIIERFLPRTHERPAGAALAALGDSSVLSATLIASIHRLVARGFASEEFKADAARCLEGVARRAKGLDDTTCRLMGSWIVEWARPTDNQEDETQADSRGRQQLQADDHHESLLWSDGQLVMLPHGNYPHLRALMAGYCLREPADIDGWLAVLERHLERDEDPKVWVALTPFLDFADADRSRSASFFKTLLERNPHLLRTLEGVRLIGHVHDWIPVTLFQHVLDGWISDGWIRGPQAAGEIAALALCRKPNEVEARERVEGFLIGSDYAATVSSGLRLGIAHTFARGWGAPALRALTTPILVRLISVPNSLIAEPLHAIFASTDPLPADDYTRELLEALLDHPSMLSVRDGTFVIDRLKELLREGWNPQLVGAVAKALVEQAGQELGDMRTSWAASADGLVEIALTLHRLPGTRVRGLDLFEQLMSVEAYGVDERLGTLDRRPFR